MIPDFLDKRLEGRTVTYVIDVDKLVDYIVRQVQDVQYMKFLGAEKDGSKILLKFEVTV